MLKLGKIVTEDLQSDLLQTDIILPEANLKITLQVIWIFLSAISRYKEKKTLVADVRKKISLCS